MGRGDLLGLAGEKTGCCNRLPGVILGAGPVPEAPLLVMQPPFRHHFLADRRSCGRSHPERVANGYGAAEEVTRPGPHPRAPRVPGKRPNRLYAGLAEWMLRDPARTCSWNGGG